MWQPGTARDAGRLGGAALPFEVRQSFWGYVVRGTEGPPILFQIAQGLVLALGAAFVAGALAVATLAPGGGFSLLRLAASAGLMAAAFVMLRYATRGGVVELHVDLARGELREVIRHRIGPVTTIGRHGFDPSASLHIRRGRVPDAPCRLLLHHRGNPQDLCIAEGPERALAVLRVRLQHDMRLHSLGRRPALDVENALPA